MTTTEQHINARNDNELLQRFIAKAEMLGVDNPSGWIQSNMPHLINATVAEGQKVSDIFAYAHETRQAYIAATPPLPGANMGAVTDEHLQAAIEAVQANQAPTE